MMKKIAAIMYFVCLTLGIIGAYQGKLAVALFFAITCAGESIGSSIDYWPRVRDRHKPDGGKERR